MSKHTISNGILAAEFSSVGAELLSLKDNSGKELIFRNESIWEFSAPTLFPICGGLKDDKYVYAGKEYRLAKHGFVRTAEFFVENASENSLTFLYTDNPETLKVYPFKFELRIVYTLFQSTLSVNYLVKNNGDGEMYFSVGCHEAYSCPGGIDKYSLIFEKPETLDSHIVRGNLLDYETNRIITDSDTLKLSYDYFSVDALAFSKFNSESITLCSDNGGRKVKVSFPGFSHLLIWTTNNVKAPYICIEPWCGFPDMVDSRYDITNRPGILRLEAGETREIKHCITAIE